MTNHLPSTDVERLLLRRELAARWGCSVETVKRRQLSGDLKPLRFNPQLLRYRFSEVEALEAAAAGEGAMIAAFPDESGDDGFEAWMLLRQPPPCHQTLRTKGLMEAILLVDHERGAVAKKPLGRHPFDERDRNRIVGIHLRRRTP